MKWKYVYIAFIMLLLAILQTSVFSRFFDITPQIVLVFVCLMAYFRGNPAGMALGLTGGLYLDFVMGRAIGFYGLVYMLGGFIIGFFPRKNIRDNFFIILLIIMAVIVPLDILIYFAKKISSFFSMGMQGFTINLGMAFKEEFLPKILNNGIVYIPLYFICKKLDKYIDRDKKLMDSF